MKLDPVRRVYVYWNLHRKCWSVRQAGRVIDHVNKLALTGCRFLVGQAGRKRVLETGRKNVHAGVSGFIADTSSRPDCPQRITYNPRRDKCFLAAGLPVYSAEYCLLESQDNRPFVFASITTTN